MESYSIIMPIAICAGAASASTLLAVSMSPLVRWTHRYSAVVRDNLIQLLQIGGVGLLALIVWVGSWVLINDFDVHRNAAILCVALYAFFPLIVSAIRNAERNRRKSGGKRGRS
jgi:ABC-type proline/glycine betaine transport system permease subunit